MPNYLIFHQYLFITNDLLYQYLWWSSHYTYFLIFLFCTNQYMLPCIVEYILQRGKLAIMSCSVLATTFVRSHTEAVTMASGFHIFPSLHELSAPSEPLFITTKLIITWITCWFFLLQQRPLSYFFVLLYTIHICIDLGLQITGTSDFSCCFAVLDALFS